MPSKHRRPTFRRTRRGFSLVEVSVATCVLVIAISGLVASMLTASNLHRVSGETARAHRAAVVALEELQGVPFAEVFRAYNANADDDAGLTVAARGANFAVQGLDARPDDGDGLCGEIQFPIVLAGTDQELREDLVDAALGLPRDLNADGVIDALDHSANYVVLPVRVLVRWRGFSGDREVRLETVLCNR